jgi:hypothetical protein
MQQLHVVVITHCCLHWLLIGIFIKLRSPNLSICLRGHHRLFNLFVLTLLRRFVTIARLKLLRHRPCYCSIYCCWCCLNGQMKITSWHWRWLLCSLHLNLKIIKLFGYYFTCLRHLLLDCCCWMIFLKNKYRRCNRQSFTCCR